jgi:hypothetical protein
MIAKISTAMPSLIVFVLLARARKSDAQLRRLQMPNDRQSEDYKSEHPEGQRHDRDRRSGVHLTHSRSDEMNA